MEDAWTQIGCGALLCGDALQALPRLPQEQAQLIIGDPPYFRVLEGEDWDNVWGDAEEYVEWMASWVAECRRILRPDGLLFVFGQLGKREHVWLHVCSRLVRIVHFDDMLIWDRVVGYNERRDSFTPQYEMILVLRTAADAKVFFDKDAVRTPYSEERQALYLRDKRYRNMAARRTHLRRGKYATNILRVPSLKGTANEKVGHPTQKPLALLEQLIRSGSRPEDLVLDPFMGSGSTAVAAEGLGRRWLGIEKRRDYVVMAAERVAGMVG